jgi:hypothetical protein
LLVAAHLNHDATLAAIYDTVVGFSYGGEVVHLPQVIQKNNTLFDFHTRISHYYQFRVQN